MTKAWRPGETGTNKERKMVEVKTEREWDAEHFEKFRTVKGTGIKFNRTYSPRLIVYSAAFVNPGGDKNQNHVYEVRISKGESGPGWRAVGYVDERPIFGIVAQAKHRTELLGFAAMKAWLKRGHRRLIRRWKEAGCPDDWPVKSDAAQARGGAA